MNKKTTPSINEAVGAKAANDDALTQLSEDEQEQLRLKKQALGLEMYHYFLEAVALGIMFSISIAVYNTWWDDSLDVFWIGMGALMTLPVITVAALPYKYRGIKGFDSLGEFYLYAKARRIRARLALKLSLGVIISYWCWVFFR